MLLKFGGPDGELGASLRYFSQRYTMPYNEVIGTLTDIATEEFAHMEIVCAIVHQLTRNLTPEQLEKSGFDLNKRNSRANYQSTKHSKENNQQSCEEISQPQISFAKT